MEKKTEILEWMKNELSLSSSETLTNWHLSDQLIDFWETFFKDDKLVSVRKKFTYYANMLVKQGILQKAQKVGVGCGGLFEWGSRTQTIWFKALKQESKKITPLEYKNGKLITKNSKGRITHIDGKSLYSYTKEELYELMTKKQ